MKTRRTHDDADRSCLQRGVDGCEAFLNDCLLLADVVVLLASSSLILLDETNDGAPGQVLVLLPIALNLQIPEHLRICRGQHTKACANAVSMTSGTLQWLQVVLSLVCSPCYL